METTLTIPKKVPSNNGKNGLIRMHWTKRRDWVNYLQVLFKTQTTNRHITPVSIHITHYYTNRPISDYDNLVSTCKLIFDALKKNGIIVDDHQLITGIPTFEQIKVKSEIKSVIHISSNQSTQ